MNYLRHRMKEQIGEEPIELNQDASGNEHPDRKQHRSSG